MSLRKSSTIEQYISDAEKVRSKNEKLQQEYNAELNGLKAETKGSPEKMQEDEFQAELTRLTTLRELAGENIEDAETEINELQAELKKAKAKENKQQAFNEAVSLAKKADKAMNEYAALVEEWNAVADRFMKKVDKAYSEWQGASKQFMGEATKVEPAFKTAFDEGSNSERNANIKTFIDKIESEAGVDTKAARCDWHINTNAFRGVFYNNLFLPEPAYGFNTVRKVFNRKKANKLKAKFKEGKRKQRAKAREIAKAQKENEAAE